MNGIQFNIKSKKITLSNDNFIAYIKDSYIINDFFSDHNQMINVIYKVNVFDFDNYEKKSNRNKRFTKIEKKNDSNILKLKLLKRIFGFLINNKINIILKNINEFGLNNEIKLYEKNANEYNLDCIDFLGLRKNLNKNYFVHEKQNKGHEREENKEKNSTTSISLNLVKEGKLKNLLLAFEIDENMKDHKKINSSFEINENKIKKKKNKDINNNDSLQIKLRDTNEDMFNIKNDSQNNKKIERNPINEESENFTAEDIYFNNFNDKNINKMNDKYIINENPKNRTNLELGLNVEKGNCFNENNVLNDLYNIDNSNEDNDFNNKINSYNKDKLSTIQSFKENINSTSKICNFSLNELEYLKYIFENLTLKEYCLNLIMNELLDEISKCYFKSLKLMSINKCFHNLKEDNFDAVINNIVEKYSPIEKIDSFKYLGFFYSEEDNKSFSVYFRKHKEFENLIDFLIYDLTKIKEAEQMEFYLKSQFFAKIAHEFKTPLNSILFLVKKINTCLENNFSNMNREIFPLINQIENFSNFVIFLINDVVEYADLYSTRKFETLKNRYKDPNNKNVNDQINNFNDYSDINSARSSIKDEETKSLRVNVEKVELKDIFNFCEDILITLLIYKGKEKNIKHGIEMDPDINDYRVFTDELRLKQILSNFIYNSVKNTKYGMITIKASLYEENKIKISVIDTGIGIKKIQLDELLDCGKLDINSNLISKKKYRGFQGGNGLGIYICKYISEKLNHKILIDSTYGKGSCFSLILKAEKINLKISEKFTNQSKNYFRDDFNISQQMKHDYYCNEIYIENFNNNSLKEIKCSSENNLILSKKNKYFNNIGFNFYNRYINNPSGKSQRISSKFIDINSDRESIRNQLNFRNIGINKIDRIKYKMKKFKQDDIKILNREDEELEFNQEKLIEGINRINQYDNLSFNYYTRHENINRELNQGLYTNCIL